MTDMEKIATDCRAAADYYDENPGHSGPETISDIYRTIERLATALDKRMAVLMPDKSNDV